MTTTTLTLLPFSFPRRRFPCRDRSAAMMIAMTLTRTTMTMTMTMTGKLAWRLLLSPPLSTRPNNNNGKGADAAGDYVVDDEGQWRSSMIRG
jgi:hypothetical protein